MAERPLALVTGASRGIGRAIALALADAGYDLWLVGRSDLEALEAVAEKVKARTAACRTSLCDVSDAAAVERLYADIGRSAGRFAALVNNAGVSGPRCDLADLDPEAIDEVLGANVKGVLLMCRGAVRLMTARGGGAIVNLSSQTAQFGGNGLTAYAASKAAVNGLTVSLAREVAGRGVRVNALSPGPVLTEPLVALPPERLEQIQASLPMGRFCTVDEVAAAVVWLLSDQASYVSGAIVPVHGAR